jgi:hypothetical protein
MMKNAQPIFDPATHCRIELQGRVDVDWLQSFYSSAEIIVDENRQMEDITVLASTPISRGSSGCCAGCMDWE